MKQAIKKGSTIKRPSIADIKATLGLRTSQDGNKNLETSSANKPLEWIVMPQAFQEATKLSGFVMGVTNIITGWSNTGKSTLKNCAIAACQRQGILPVIFETENNFDFNYAIDCGMEATPVYGEVEVEDIDETTGDIIGTHVENKVIDYEGNFLYYDSAILAEKYGDNDYSTGKKSSKKRKVAVIEDIAYAINEILDYQDEGVIQQPICFFWDSIGSISGWKSYTSKVGNAMFDAASLSAAFNTIINNRIPSSKRIDNPYTNTLICVNKIWNNSMATMGLPSYKLKGGESFVFGARLICHLGSVGQASTKKLTATAKGQTYNYGIVTKIRITKNQITSLTYEGTICCLHNGIYSENDLDSYKKTYAKELLKKIETVGSRPLDASENDISFGEEECEE